MAASFAAFFVDETGGASDGALAFGDSISPVGDFNTLFGAGENIQFSHLTGSVSSTRVFTVIFLTLLIITLISDIFVALFKLNRLEKLTRIFSFSSSLREFNAFLFATSSDNRLTFLVLPRGDEFSNGFFDVTGRSGEVVGVLAVEVTAETGELVFVFGGGLDVGGLAVPGDSVAGAGDG